MKLTDREKEIIRVALSYMGSNLDDVNEATEGIRGEDFKEEEVFELYGRMGRTAAGRGMSPM